MKYTIKSKTKAVYFTTSEYVALPCNTKTFGDLKLFETDSKDKALEVLRGFSSDFEVVDER